MVKVFYTNEIKRLEKETCEQRQICEKDLMYQAGYVLTKDFLSRVRPNVNEQILVVANTGNNGGDALVVFQELENLGYRTTLAIVGDLEKASEAFNEYYNRITNKNQIINIKDFEKALKTSRYLIDGIFGIGLKRDVSDEYQALFEKINNAKVVRYSIDIPSGINPDNGLVMKAAIKADYTGVVGNYKLGNFLNDALDYVGEMKLLDIGLLAGYSDIYYMDYNEIDIKRKRAHNSYKYSYGNLAFAGSAKMPGAISLSAIAALKSGAGLATILTEKEATKFYPEVIYERLVDKDLLNYDVVCFGPGINELDEQHRKHFDLLVDNKRKMLVDAGGLKFLDLRKKYENVVITPHLKELSDLLKVEKDALKKDPIKHLRNLADKGFITLFKGATTIIQDQRNTFLLQAKNHGLATAGSGDVLAGIITSFMADESNVNACLKGFAVHAIAADYARNKFGEISMTSSDLVNNLYKVWMRKR
jgi:NAD(P)H-hydrate epimerase